jgi:hypothetical protein
MLALLVLAAIIPSASGPLIARAAISDAFLGVIYFSLVGASVGVAIFMITRRQLVFGRACLIVSVALLSGTLLSVATTTAISPTLIGLAKFILPLGVLACWFDNFTLKHVGAREAPYLIAGMLSGLAIASLIPLFFGGGYDVNRLEFNGLVWNSQILGLSVVLLIPLMFHTYRLPVWLRLGMGLIAMLLVWIAWSRTGLVAFVILCCAEGLRLILLPTFDRWQNATRQNRVAWKKIALRANSVLLSCLALSSLWLASNIAKVEPGPNARGEVLSMEGYASTRAMVLDRSYTNFQAHLLTGIGFGVPSDMRLLDPAFAAANLHEMKQGTTDVISPNKGNSYVSAFEENGIVGAGIWLGIFFYFAATIATKSPAGLSIATLIVACAFGEASIFIPNDIGLIQWVTLMTAAGFSSGSHTQSAPERAGGQSRTAPKQRRRGRSGDGVRW